MNIQRIFAVYFSPTHGTRTYVEGIARRLSPTFETIDLTRPENREKDYTFSDNDLLVLGAPVYAGRLPAVQGGIFNRLQGHNTPAIFTVTYGNRDFDDALLEEKDLCESNGFVGIAAAGLIAPHTFSDKVAAQRPDSEDEKQLDAFAEKIKGLMGAWDKNSLTPSLTVRGNHPYKDSMVMPFHPIANESCTNCNSCVSVCPTGAIALNAPQQTDTTKCIDCFACVKTCPVHARDVSNPMLQGLVQKLETLLIDVRKTPEFFF